MTIRDRRPWFAILIAVLLILSGFGLTVDVKAQDITDAPSRLTITALPSYPVGDRVIVNVELVNTKGVAIPNKPILVFVNGERVRRARTDDQGLATINIGKELPVGEHLIEAVFIGTEAYRQSTATTTMTIRPLELIIETFPPMMGMRFNINGTIYEADADGFVRVAIDMPGTYSVETILPELDERETDTLVHFDRWGDAVFTPERDVEVNGDTWIQAGFALHHRVRQQFVDLNGGEVDGSRVDTLTLKSSYGSFHTFDDGNPHWLQANRIARRSTGLEVTLVQYSVESVIIDGANVVNRYQQRFFLEPEDTWTIELLLYFASVTAKDAIFGFPLGEGITVEYPNTTVESLTFNEDNQVFLGPLARGDYKLQVTGVKGMAPPTPVALSRDQEVILKVLSAFDIGLGLTLGAMFGFGLLFYGRPELIHLPKDIVIATKRLSQDVLSNRDEKFGINWFKADRSTSNGTYFPEPKLISKAPMYGWHDCYRINGVQNVGQLDKQPHRWKVTPAYLTRLDETLAQGPGAYGYDFTMWTRERLRDHLEQQTNIRISVSWLGTLLKERGYVYRRPHRNGNNGVNGGSNHAAHTIFDEVSGD